MESETLPFTLYVLAKQGIFERQIVEAPRLEVLRRIETRGIFETAHRVRSICGRVLRYGKATGRGCTDVAADLIGLLTPVKPEHMAAIVDPIRAGDLLRSIEGYRGETVTRLALKLSPYVFPRPIAFRTMEWSHVNLDGPTPEWRIPWKRMKMLVPLSRQAVAILREIRVHTGSGRYVSRSCVSRTSPCRDRRACAGGAGARESEQRFETNRGRTRATPRIRARTTFRD